MGSLAPFLPPHLVRSLATRGLPARLPHVDRFPAALLFSDISGFTALTERLQAGGREGAEEIAELISSVFRPAIRCIERWGGSIQSFGGDALFVVFGGASPVVRALGAARGIRRSFEARGDLATSAGPVNLRISQAIHWGPVSGRHLGSADQRHYLVAGETVVRLARLEERASGGRLLLSPEARERQTRERTPRVRVGREASAARTVIGRYVPQRLQPLLSGFEGEYRKAAVLFFETREAGMRAQQRFFMALDDVLGQYGGLLLKTDLSAVGTKWLCVFGVPSAHEDDAERAAHAALQMKEAADCPVRGGLHFGTVANVVIGSRRRKSFDVMGGVVNAAARAAAGAAWGEVVITEETRWSLPRGFETAPRGKRAVKGLSEPLEVHALLRVTHVAKPIRLSAPLIGRAPEIARLREALVGAAAGSGSAIGIKGEPGIGKSRLKWEASRLAEEMGFSVHEGRAIAFGSMPYRAIGELLRSALGLPELCGREATLGAVAKSAEQLGLKAVDRHHVAEVLGARYDGSPLPDLDGRSIRLNNMIAVRALCRGMARRRPRLLVLEDMQWADELTGEAAAWLAADAKAQSFTLLLLYRPSYGPSRRISEIALGDLSSDDVDALLAAHLGMVPPKVAALVKERAGGNPFYVEELARHLLETGLLEISRQGYRMARPPRPADLPASVESLIAARLDRLSLGARKVAQHGAVIGRNFLFELLARLPDVARRVGRSVDELCRRELVFEKQRDPHLEYVFKHALTRDVAYASILARRRRSLHRAVALALEELFTGERDAFLAMLGHHWQEAGDRGRAREYYLASARKAVERYGHEEAERTYRAYLALVERPSKESITARSELASNVMHQRGRVDDAIAELTVAVAEARELGDAVVVAACLNALGRVRSNTGRIDEARALYEEALAISRGSGDPKLEGILLGNLGIIHEGHGRSDEALALYEQALAIHRRHGNRKSEGAVLGHLANLHMSRGRLDDARVLYEQAIGICRELGERGREGGVLGNLAILYQLQGRAEAALAQYEGALAIHREVGNRREEGIVLGNLASLHVSQGDFEDGRALYDEAFAIAREVGERGFEGNVLAGLADLERLTAGDPSRMEELTRNGESLLAAVGDRLELGKLLCARGHVALAAGTSANHLIGRARRLAAEAGALPDSEIGKSISRLERAQRAFLSGGLLFRGQLVDDLTPGQRDRFESRGELSPP